MNQIWDALHGSAMTIANSPLLDLYSLNDPVFDHAKDYATRSALIKPLNPTNDTGSPNFFIPLDYIVHDEVPIMLVFAAFLTVVYTVAFYLVDPLLDSATFTILKKRKVCYQITNFVCNSILGAVGLYLQFFVIPRSAPYSLQDVITGFYNVTAISCLQLGYQLWSIPMGCFYVPETTQMLIHHVCVVVCCSMTAFFTTGFRYYTPFFYGIMEISSLPLAIMNTMKDNPSFCASNPITYLTTRVIFAVVFLVIRVYMVIPRKSRYLTDHFLLWSRSEVTWFRYYMIFVFCCSTFLLVLQFYWAVLIIKGIINQFVFKRVKKPKDHDFYTNGIANGAGTNGVHAASKTTNDGSINRNKTNGKKYV